MASRPGKAPTTLMWREAFDAFERPIAAVSEAWVQTPLFMDGVSALWRIERGLLERFQKTSATCLRAFNVPSRQDVRQVVVQVAALDRQVRELRRALEAQPAPLAPARSEVT
jgi:hypothetical protein